VRGSPDHAAFGRAFSEASSASATSIAHAPEAKPFNNQQIFTCVKNMTLVKISPLMYFDTSVFG
jgi:hypothetical protein